MPRSLCGARPIGQPPEEVLANQVTQTRGQDAGLPAAPCASRPGVTERRQDRAAAPARGWTTRSRGWHKLRKNSAVSLGNCWVRCCIAYNGDRHGGQSYRCLSASLLANTIHSATTSAVAAAAKANAHRLIGFPRGSRACGKAPRMSRPRGFLEAASSQGWRLQNSHAQSCINHIVGQRQQANSAGLAITLQGG